MALDPNRWTIKTQEAFTQATEAARANSNPEVTPDHLLAALLRQEEGVVLPILNRVGTQPLCRAQRRRRGGVEAAEVVRHRRAPLARDPADHRGG